MTVPGLYSEHDLFILLMKMKYRLRHLNGEALITHLGLEYYDYKSRVAPAPAPAKGVYFMQLIRVMRVLLGAQIGAAAVDNSPRERLQARVSVESVENLSAGHLA